ncbi:MAG: short-chain dehydrogenase [Rhodospirillaceae bacterium]|nr:short-chain dehydrogenase [Rhodospirillaceae bacterium]
MSRTALVTGASKGIGLAIAKHLAAAGTTVIGIARSDPDEEFPGPYFKVDLEDDATVVDSLAEIVAKHPVDILVNNAGYSLPATAEGTTLPDFDKQISVNLRGALICSQAVIPGMKDRKFGRIVHMASRAMMGKEERTSYGAAKAGLVGFSRIWALELGPFGITVNAVSPGPIQTALFLRNHPPGTDKHQELVDAMPVRRLGEPEDIAHAVSFLVADEAGFVTGQTIHVCGGMTIGAPGI